MKRPRFITGNRIALLQNGEAFFPALEEAIRAARGSVWLETYIFSNDAIGRRVRDALTDAASRGVEVRLVIDGFGSAGLPQGWWQAFERAGGELRVYRPGHRWWPLKRSQLRRLHRKLVVVDRQLAFAGGINIQDDWDIPGQTAPRFDFAVRVEGPLVARMAMAMEKLWWRLNRGHTTAVISSPDRKDGHADVPRERGAGRAALVLRDNLRHRFDIERAYLDAIARAREEVLIANAYFLPGRRFRRALIHAARRRIRVRLLLQGMVEYRLQHAATRALYGSLLEHGIEIHEYAPSHLHAKVAVIDGAWATVGSSNIDPFSLLLAREANVVVEDAAFAEDLKQRLDHAIATQSWQIEARSWQALPLLIRLRCWLAYGVVRWIMGVAGVLRQW